MLILFVHQKRLLYCWVQLELVKVNLLIKLFKIKSKLSIFYVVNLCLILADKSAQIPNSKTIAIMKKVCKYTLYYLLDKDY